MTLRLICDGYTREEQFPAADGHPDVWISYRPMLAVERRRLAMQTIRLNARGGDGADAAAKLFAAAVAARLVAWDLADDSGKLLEISPEAVAGLDPLLFEKIYATIAPFEDEEDSAKN